VATHTALYVAAAHNAALNAAHSVALNATDAAAPTDVLHCWSRCYRLLCMLLLFLINIVDMMMLPMLKDACVANVGNVTVTILNLPPLLKLRICCC